MLYRILKFLIGIGIRLYYREIKIRNKEFLRHDGPLIIIANHPNTMMDAWIIAQSISQPIYFMAKGTFFNTPLKRWILNSLGMIPINRPIDNKTAGVNNNASFEACYKVLEEGKTLVVFPEGNSMMERQLRELKSGTARIALEVEQRNAGKLNLKVVPIGIFYSQGEKFRSSVMLTIEQGLFVDDLLDEYAENPSVASKKLTSRFRQHLERVLVTTDSLEQEKLIDDVYDIVKDEKSKASVESRVEYLKQISDRIEEIQLLKPFLIEEIQTLVNQIQWQTEKLKIRQDLLNKRFKLSSYSLQLFFSVIYAVVGFPVFIFGLIHSIVPFKGTELLMPKLIKNVEYYAPIAVLLGLVVYPINYSLFIWTAGILFQLSLLVKVLYFCAMPITGMFAYYYIRFFSKTAYRWKYLFVRMNEGQALNELTMLRTRLNDLIHSLD
ncbi:MAG: lysophospholipid acyltransferase family protein [Flavobacteriia bacterium]|jgi:1-acyl-sn-glycerol-3-phosphate acyltransferase